MIKFKKVPGTKALMFSTLHKVYHILPSGKRLLEEEYYNYQIKYIEKEDEVSEKIEEYRKYLLHISHLYNSPIGKLCKRYHFICSIKKGRLNCHYIHFTPGASFTSNELKNYMNNTLYSKSIGDRSIENQIFEIKELDLLEYFGL